MRLGAIGVLSRGLMLGGLEFAGDLVLQQSVTIVSEARMIEARLVQLHVGSSTTEQQQPNTIAKAEGFAFTLRFTVEWR